MEYKFFSEFSCSEHNEKSWCSFQVPEVSATVLRSLSLSRNKELLCGQKEGNILHASWCLHDKEEAEKEASEEM